jgi:acyl-CoA synthetase (AMP-forming)/AMP-acid ligase II
MVWMADPEYLISSRIITRPHVWPVAPGPWRPGDLAYLDKEGFLHIVDRLARFSKIAGEMIPHLKIEEALSEVVGAGQCIVVGVPRRTPRGSLHR